MNQLNQAAQVTLSLPAEIYDQLVYLSLQEQRPVSDVLNMLIVEALEARSSIQQILQAASKSYQEHLAQLGTLDQTSEQVLQALQDIREQVANELYP